MKARHEFESDDAYSAYLRTYLAAMALQGMLANSCFDWMDDDSSGTQACFHADALIAVLNEKEV